MPWSKTFDLERNVPRLVSQPGFVLVVGSWQNAGHTALWVRPQVGEVVPTPEVFMEGAFLYQPGIGEENQALATLWLGLPGANRLFAMTEYAEGGRFAVQHA